MKLFGIKLLSISIVFVSILYGVDYLIQEGLKTSNYREVSKWNEVITGGIEADILIVGSSRALVHYDCELIEEITGKKCYNLGFDGTLFKHQQLMLDLYLKNNKAPETLVWNVDYHSFGNSREFYGFEQLMPYQNQLEVKLLLKANEVTDPMLYQIPLVRYSFNPKMKTIGILNYIGLYSERPALIKGYQKRDKVWDGKFDELKMANKNGILYEFNDALFQEFSEELEELKQREMNIYLVVSPIYHEAKALVSNSDEVTCWLRNLSQMNDFIFLDYSNDSINYNKNFFYNGTHLNEEGVNFFMKNFSVN
tara:strand:- start:239 stop:1165 length:927 start_codon:yes stop_codon:yes gene_type:complete